MLLHVAAAGMKHSVPSRGPAPEVTTAQEAWRTETRDNSWRDWGGSPPVRGLGGWDRDWLAETTRLIEQRASHGRAPLPARLRKRRDPCGWVP